jgi:hypothetical protein
MREVLQRDPPHKSHIVAERIDKSTVKTECGLTFELPNGMEILTFEYDPKKPSFERTYNPPVSEGQCGNCPWDNE